jgi:signal transduction histidine kinase
MKLPLRFAGRARSGARPDSHAGPSVQTLSIRVALAATAIVGAAYILLSVAATAVVVTNLTSDVDRHLDQSLQLAANFGQPGAGPDAGQGQPGFDPTHQDPRGLQIVLWTVGADGKVVPQGATTLPLPAAGAGVTAPATVSIGGVDYRITGRTFGTTRVIVGQSLDVVAQTTSTLILAEVGIGAALLIFVFLGSVAVGRRVALPVERARQRQLEFTADASHELRTPLSVIEAHSSLALARARDPNWDGAAFGRIDTELKRTRRLVDDMLWLARFDSTGALPPAEPVDVSVLAAQTADRFAAVAETRGQHLEVRTGAPGVDAMVTAAPEWLDRLVGILLDNACKYSPDGGTVTVGVVADGRRVRLTVDDSGPGIPEAERSRVFDRFHRATDQPGGAGLGLAIADAIVRSTGGRWRIGTSPAGGAGITVTWPRYTSAP